MRQLPIVREIPRSIQREKTVVMRCSPDQHAELMARAAADGLSLQIYLERKLLDPNARPRRAGKPRSRMPNQEEIDDLSA